jgi:hypothetical protein
MNLDVFYQVIIPLFEVKNAALICISSPLDRVNFYSKLLNLVNPLTKKSIFITYQLRLACEMCMKTEHPSKCKHNLKYIPFWKSESKLEIVKLIMEEMETVLQRESYGIISDSMSSLFPQYAIKEFQNKSLYEPNIYSGAKTVLITCDPNEGGPNEFSLIASVNLYGQIILVGMSSHICKDVDDVFYVFDEFIKQLRKHPWLEHSWFVFVAERNTGREAGHLQRRFILHKGNSFSIKQKPDKDYGWWTSNIEKLRYAYWTRDKIVENAITFLDSMIVTSVQTDMSFQDDLRKKVIEKLFDQMQRYQEKELQGLSGASIPKVAISGKMDEEGKLKKGQNDDLMFTLTFNIGIWKKIVNREIDSFPYQTVLK